MTKLETIGENRDKNLFGYYKVFHDSDTSSDTFFILLLFSFLIYRVLICHFGDTLNPNMNPMVFIMLLLLKL
jgi:hypothetical protein